MKTFLQLALQDQFKIELGLSTGGVIRNATVLSFEDDDTVLVEREWRPDPVCVYIALAHIVAANKS